MTLADAGASARPGAWSRFKGNRIAFFGLLLVVLLALIGLLAPLLPLADPDATDLARRLEPPFGEGHWLGTDQLGRDLLSRLVWGMRVSLAVGCVATLAAALIGSFIGLVAGFYGRWIDQALMRGIDMLMAFPYLLLALAIVAVLGPGLLNALFAIAVVNVPFFARIVRGVTRGLSGREFVDAARLSGFSDARILAGEVFPNVLPIIVITMSTTVGWMILETAGLSFLGLGAQPPQADLGSILGDGYKLVVTAPHLATIPGVVILLLVLGINLAGDGLRDLLDPRLKSGEIARPAAATAFAGEEKPGMGQGERSRTLLKVEGLRSWFSLGDQLYRAVDGIGFELGAGEALGIVGESGSGKTVTALSILRLVPSPPGRIVAGRIDYRGEDLARAPLETLQRIRGNRIAYVFQDPLSTLNPLFPVGEQIAESMRRHRGVPRASALRRAVELLERVGIERAAARARSYPHELSGGMRQRVVIAMALANDPEVLIADEPTTALDVTLQAQVLALLNETRRERGASLLFISHDFGVISEVCERVLVMYAGRVVEAGSLEEVLREPRHPYTRALLDCVPRLGEADRPLGTIAGLPPAANALPEGCAFAERCPLALAACRRGEIALDPLGPGRAVRCIRAREDRR